jgi:sirohydrochlorin ferrochelatase
MTDAPDPDELPGADALLVIGHGTREPQGVEQFHQVVEQLRARLAPRRVEPAFLELCPPAIPDAIAALAGAGVTRVTAAPLLLFAAGHAQHDIPALLAAARVAHPQIEFRQASCLECHRAIVELSALRFHEAIDRDASPPAAESSDTLLLLVGRGSREPAANAEMYRFARLRFEKTPIGLVEICFTALTEPSLERGLEIAAALPFRRIVVQPHLLFDGELLRRIQTRVAAVGAADHQRKWVVTEPLGPHQLLADAVIELASAAAAR